MLIDKHWISSKILPHQKTFFVRLQTCSGFAQLEERGIFKCIPAYAWSIWGEMMKELPQVVASGASLVLFSTWYYVIRVIFGTYPDENKMENEELPPGNLLTIYLEGLSGYSGIDIAIW